MNLCRTAILSSNRANERASGPDSSAPIYEIHKTLVCVYNTVGCALVAVVLNWICSRLHKLAFGKRTVIANAFTCALYTFVVCIPYVEQ